MNVKNPIFAAICIAGLSSMPAMADVYTDKDGNKMECHYETVKGDDGHPVAAPIAGAVVGGVVGHQFGGGTGSDIATVAGAGAGAYAGKKYNDNQVDKHSENGTKKKVCKPVS